jgi:hypothetical protein
VAVPPRKPAPLAAALSAILEDGALLARLEAESAAAATRWTSDDAAAAHHALYEELLAEADGAHAAR